ncbi:hypothetical protein [Chishuiella sp.]|uniref:hypothetical protein n=1 Tax=Chishuiella sp. TaxID=1969467 RepID=UPI0028AE763F|nr:hypothetical protein [Chishuiella sp.]
MRNLGPICFLFSFFLVCCGQNKEEIKNMNPDKITLDNYKEKMLNEIKHYPEEPIYYIYVHNSLCLYEMLVNDFPIEKRFKYSTSGTPFYINRAILKSGKQKLTFRIYPAPKEYNKGSDVLSQFAKLSFEILVNDNVTGLEIDNEKIILQGEAPQIKAKGYSGGQYFAGMGKKYYEYSVEFEAKVPYELESWTAGEDLRKFDPKKLEEKALQIYDVYRNNLTTDKLENILQMQFDNNIRDFITEYETEERVNKMYEEVIEGARRKKDWQDFGHKMVFYGDGRILSLIQSNEEDVRLRGRSSLFYLYNNDKNAFSTHLYLYIPRGGTIDDLQVLR